MGAFWQKKHLVKREIRLMAICRTKFITSNDYSPTNKSPFRLLKPLTQKYDSKSNWGTSPVSMRYGHYLITADKVVFSVWSIVTGKMYNVIK